MMYKVAHTYFLWDEIKVSEISIDKNAPIKHGFVQFGLALRHGLRL
jgi:hypothetical protein